MFTKIKYHQKKGSKLQKPWIITRYHLNKENRHSMREIYNFIKEIEMRELFHRKDNEYHQQIIKARSNLDRRAQNLLLKYRIEE